MMPKLFKTKKTMTLGTLMTHHRHRPIASSPSLVGLFGYEMGSIILFVSFPPDNPEVNDEDDEADESDDALLHLFFFC